MPSFIQTPAEFPITFVVGDELSVGLSFTTGGTTPAPINLTGYTFEAKVFVPTYANPDGGFGSGAYTMGATAATFTVSPVSLSGGTVSVGLSETQTATLSASTGYRWYFRWTDANGYTRTVLAGALAARIP